MKFQQSVRARLSALTAAFLLLSACGDERGAPESETKTQAVYAADHARILGFESPASDWTAQRVDGGPIDFAASNTSSQGSSSASVTTSSNGEFILTNQVLLDSLGAVGQSVEVDVWAPSIEQWSSATFVVESGSQQLWYRQLGQAQLAQVATAGEFSRLSFALGDAQSVLSSTYDDLKVILKINGPPGTYLVDRISFGGDAVFDSSGTGGSSGGDGDGGASSGGSSGGGTAGGGQAPPTSEMVIRVPRETSFNEVALGAQDEQLDIHNAVFVFSGQPDPNLTVSQQAYADSASVGDTFTNVGVAARIGGVFSVPFVDIKNHASLRGLLWAEDGFTVGDGVSLLGGAVAEQSLSPYNETKFTYAFPTELQHPAGLAANGVLQNGASLALEPGGYVGTTVQSDGTTLTLQGPGAFYFDSLRVESGANLVIDNSDGAVFVVVRDDFRFKGTQTKASPNKHNILFAYEGTNFVDPVDSFQGTLLAPNAIIDIPTGDHRPALSLGRASSSIRRRRSGTTRSSGMIVIRLAG